MYLEIKQIAEVFPGYTFREAIESNSLGKTFVLQAKNVKKGENIKDTAEFTKISYNIPRSSAYLQYNDVLIISRGMGAGTFRSSVFKGENENVLASSSVHIIRINDMNIIPEYLSLYLNSLDGQRAISQKVSGSHFQTILRKNLEELVVPVPSIDIQNNVVYLADNINEQEKIAKRVSEIKKNLMNGIFGHISNL